ncbi:MAG: phasin family protein [Candidatus Competibacteraceae bacterium]|nr:phasin family protein [Candidatus Competibacteraceae bacterium]
MSDSENEYRGQCIMKTDLPEENQYTRNIQDFTRQIWLAGLGAFARAQNEGGKVFDTLVQAGQAIDSQTKKAVHAKTAQLKESIEAAHENAAAIRGKVAGSWSKLEEVFQARTARALSQLGVPTQEDIQQLFQQVEQLNQNIQELTRAAESEASTGKKPLAKVAESATNTKDVSSSET